MVKSIGIDLEENKRFKRLCKNKNFISQIFTKKEIDYCKKKKEPWISFAGKFCAKEALIKAIKKPLEIKDIEILNDKFNKIKIYFKGKIIKNVLCSISHTKNDAIAIVIVK